jgi:threonylcarbamoyladenosine tRNA methylthiotransferase MtaB
MKTYAVHTLGCKVNQYESQQIRQLLERCGLSAADAAQRPDVVIVNTCCVTHIASAKSRQSIRKAQYTSPDAHVIVTGCLPAGQDSELKNLSNILVVKDKNKLPAIFDRFFRVQPPDLPAPYISKPINADKIKDKNEPLAQIYPLSKDKIEEKNVIDPILHLLPPLTRFSGHCRAFLKVQDGCDACCTYCIIPKIRKNVCNKDVKSVQEEAKQLISAGHKEIVLIGICLGAYGQTTARRKKWKLDKRDALAGLVDSVAKLDGLERLRLSSLGPLDVTEKLLEVMASHDNIMPHFHLSLQSGSDNILRKMARQYTIDDFLQVVERIKSAFDRPAITTDIIVGFPGETEADFEETVKVAEQVGFAKIHVFSFSPRKNTPAIKMAKLFGRVNAQEIKRRSSVLQEVDKRLQEQFRRSCIGLKENILIETTRPLRGRCSRYFMVDLSNHPNSKTLRKGDTINVII